MGGGRGDYRRSSTPYQGGGSDHLVRPRARRRTIGRYGGRPNGRTSLQISRLHQELASGGDPYWAEQVGIQEAAATAWIALGEKQVTRCDRVDAGRRRSRGSDREACRHGEPAVADARAARRAAAGGRQARRTRCASSSARCETVPNRIPIAGRGRRRRPPSWRATKHKPACTIVSCWSSREMQTVNEHRSREPVSSWQGIEARF